MYIYYINISLQWGYIFASSGPGSDLRGPEPRRAQQRRHRGEEQKVLQALAKGSLETSKENWMVFGIVNYRYRYNIYIWLYINIYV